MTYNQDDELDPMFAAGNPFSGGNSSFNRSMRARRQLRDSKGRWIPMGGGLSLGIRMPNGNILDLNGRSVGASNRDGYAQLFVPEGSNEIPAGVYDVPAGNGVLAQAILPGSSPTIPWQGSASDSNIIDFKDMVRRDAPEDWTKNDDGSFSTEDGEFTVARTEDGQWSLSQNDEDKGTYRDAATAITRAAAIDAENNADEDTKKRVATLRTEGADQDAIDRVLFDDPELQKDDKAEAAPAEEEAATRDSADVRAELNDAKERFEALETELDSTEDADRQGEIVDEMTALNEEIGALEAEYNKARLAELPAESTGQNAPDTVESLTRRIAQLDGRAQQRAERGQDTDELDKQIADLEQKRQALIDSGETDGGAETDGGTEGTLPDDLVGEDARGPRVERRGNSLWDVSGNVVATKVDDVANAEEIREGGAKVVDLYEVDPKHADVFRDALIEAANSNPYGKSVTIHDLEYYQKPGVRLFLTQDGKGGIALNEDEIVSGFMGDGASDRGQGAVQSMVSKMVELGGRRLDAYDTILPKLYAEAGFKPVARIKWDDEFAPEGWDYELYDRYNGGRPDIVFMAYDPALVGSKYNPSEGDYVDDYDKGLPAQQAALEGVTEQQVIQNLTDRQKAAQERRAAAQAANDALAGGDGLLEGEVPSNARGTVGNQNLQLAPIGQVVEATSRNGRKRRFIKVGKDTWKRTDKPDDKKRYRSHELRGGTAAFVPRTEADVPSMDEARGPVDRYRPKPFSFPRGASDEELARLREMYQNQADNDTSAAGALRAGESVRLIDMNIARRKGEPVARLRPATERRLADQRAGRPTEPAGVRAPRRARRGTAPLLTSNSPGTGTNPEAYTPSGDMPEGTTDDPQELAQIFDINGLRPAYYSALIGNEDTIRLQFPGQNGQPGPEANVPVDAVRDTLQHLGFNTNTLMMRSENDRQQAPQINPFEELPEDAEAPSLTPQPEPAAPRIVPAFENGRNQSAGQQLAHLYQTVEELDAAISLFPSNGDRRELKNLIDNRAGILRRIRTLEAEGFRNTYDVQNVDLSNFEWDANTPDIHNPDLILEALKQKYPNAEILPNGDIKIGENFVTDANGNRFKYEAIITKTDDEMFYTYIRETNLAEQDPTKAVRSIRVGEMRQSARAVNNQAMKALDKIYNRAGRSNIHSWFNDRRRAREGNPPRFDLPDENGVPTHVKDAVFTREAVRKIQEAVNDDQITEEMISTLFNYIKNFGNGEEVAAALYESFGLDLPTMNRFVDAVNANIADREGLRRFSKWESDNGTPLAEGDLVEYSGEEGQTGHGRLFGRKGIVKIRQLEHTVDGGYTYTDYVYIQLLDDNGNPTNEEYQIASSHNLRLLETAGGTDGSERVGPNGVFVPSPALTRRAVNRYAGRGRLRSVSPFIATYNRDSLASPKVQIDGVDYPVQISRASVIGRNFDNVAATPSELEVGDFIRTYEDIDGYPTARLNEVVGIEELEDGSRLVHTVMPINVSSGRVSSTEYSDDMGVQLDVYRPTPEEPTDRNATGLDNGQVARLAEALRGADRSKLSEEALGRIREILNSTDPASLPYTQRQFADVFMEVMQAQRTGTAGTVTPEEASRVIERLNRYGAPTADAASATERVRRAGLQRSGQLRPRPASTYAPSTPRRATNPSMDLTNLQQGPFTNNEGASSIGAEEFRAALERGDQAVIENEIKKYVGGKVFGSKFALDGVRVSVSQGNVSWGANIVDPATGRVAGTTSRYYYIEDGKLIVKHSSIFINADSDKGTGFATEYKKVSDNFYKSIGVDKIKIQTVSDGSYAWGKANYTWNSPSDARSVRHQLERHLASAERRNQADNVQILQDMLDRFDKPFNDPDFPDPIDVANLQKSDGTPWGREIMTNSGWFGIRYLNPSLDPRPKNRQDKGKKEAPVEAPAEAPATGSEFVDESGNLTSPDWVDEAPDGSVVRVTDPSGYHGIYVKQDGAWVEASYGSANRAPEPTDIVSEATLKALIKRSIETESNPAQVAVTPEDVKKYEDYLTGNLSIDDLSPEDFKAAFENQDKAVLDAAIIGKLFGDGEQKYGDFYIRNARSIVSRYITTGKPRYTVEADITDADGNVVGSVQRVIRLNEDGNIRVIHALMKIENSQNKNSGFGTQFSAAAEELYNKLGVAEITTDTAWDGSYVWGRAGYDWNFVDYSKPTALGAIPGNLQSARQSALSSGRMEDARKLEDIIDRLGLGIDDPNFPTPFEIANLVSEDPGMTSWARKIMGYTDWHGIKRLGKYGKSGEQYAREQEAQRNANPEEASADVYTDGEGETE